MEKNDDISTIDLKKRFGCFKTKTTKYVKKDVEDCMCIAIENRIESVYPEALPFDVSTIDLKKRFGCFKTKTTKYVKKAVEKVFYIVLTVEDCMCIAIQNRIKSIYPEALPFDESAVGDSGRIIVYFTSDIFNLNERTKIDALVSLYKHPRLYKLVYHMWKGYSGMISHYPTALIEILPKLKDSNWSGLVKLIIYRTI